MNEIHRRQPERRAEPLPAPSSAAAGTADRSTGGRRAGRAGLAASALSLLVFGALALLGPSAVQPGLGGGLPPWSLSLDPSPYLVVTLMAVGIVLGGAGTGLCLLAVRRGWRPRTRPLLAAGVLAAAAFAVMPPVGSSDHLNYAAYGHMAVTGLDPYRTAAADLPADDVYGLIVQEWRTTPSIYGPIVTASQSAAAWVGGDSVRTTVFLLSVLNGLVFIGVSLLLYLRGKDEDRRRRAVLIWALNPLLLFHLVSGAHNDVLGIAAAVLALTVFTAGAGTLRRAFGTGLVVGAAIAIKLPAGLVGGGPAWRLLRERGRPLTARGGWGPTAALFGGSGLVVLVAYAIAGPRALDQVGNASDFVSLANPWHLLGGKNDGVLGLGVAKPVISVLSLLLMIYLVRLLARALPPDGADDALRVSAALVLGWLFAASYALPWYDGLGWAVLALLPWSRFDGVLLARTVALSLAYLPARDPVTSGLPSGMHWLVTVLRSEIMPFVLASVLLLLVWTARRTRPPVPAP